MELLDSSPMAASLLLAHFDEIVIYFENAVRDMQKKLLDDHPYAVTGFKGRSK
jgi:hypothetical protein